jgi:hypothetical protein
MSGSEAATSFLRGLPGEAEHILAAGEVDQLRCPVTCRIRRIEPLERDHARPATAAHRQADAVDPLRGLADQIDRRVLGVCGLCDRSGIAQNLSQRVRIERDHHRLTVDLRRDFAHVVVGDGADRAQRLGDDQLGLQVVQRVGVELVDRLSVERPLLDGRVDLGGAETVRQLVPRNPGQGCRLRWVVALMGDADDVIAQSEGEQQLGRGRNQAHDAHAR